MTLQESGHSGNPWMECRTEHASFWFCVFHRHDGGRLFRNITARLAPKLTGKGSVVYIFIAIFIAVFLVELLIMFTLHEVSPQSTKLAFVDASLLIVFLSPILYFLIFQPMITQTESALHKSKSALEHAQRIAHLGSWEWDSSDNNISWSDEMYRIFGVSQKSFRPDYDNFLSLVHPDDRERVAGSLAASLAQCASYDDEYRILRPDGSERVVHSYADTRCNDQGQALHISGTSLDITSSKQLENELRDHRNHLQELVDERTGELVIAKDRAEAADKAKSLFLAAVSHELKTPLNAIIGFSDLLADGSAGPVTEEQKEYLDILQSSGQNLLSLVNNILDLSRMGAGNVHLDLNEFDLDLSMTNWVQAMQQAFENKNISLSMAVESGIGTITADELRLKAAAFHLLSNALKFTDSGGSARLAARSIKGDADKGHGEDWVEISVTDTGIGISPDAQHRLFRPFVQLDDALHRQYEGTGLGLMICKHIVELHGGQIWATSEPGKGSTFSFKIPRHSGTSEPLCPEESL